MNLLKMAEEVGRLYREERFPFQLARETVIRKSGLNQKHWPELRTQLSSILGQRGGRKNKGKKKTRSLFSKERIKEMIQESKRVMAERHDDLLLDP